MNDVTMVYIKDDVKKIQTKTNLYIQQYGPQGAFHLAREIIQNAIDELIDPDSIGNSIKIEYDLSRDKLTVTDDGRGFPENKYPVDVFFTTIQSGSKFFRSQSGGTSGEYGLGATAVNALSSKMTVTNYRFVENYIHTVEFKEGAVVSDTKVKQKDNAKHGSMISFIPNPKYLGANTHIPYNDLKDWVNKMSYLLPAKSNIKMSLDLYNKNERKEHNKYKRKDFKELLSTLSSSELTDVCSFSGNGSIEENVRMLDSKGSKVKEQVLTKDVYLEAALCYEPDMETVYDSYCNFTNTTEGGIHQATVDACFCRFMQNAVNKSLSDTQKEKLGITWDDVRSGLRCVINLYTSAQVGFVGNAKQKIANEELVPVLKEIINKALNDFFENHQSLLNDFIKIIKSNAKARIEMMKVKTATQKERMTSLSEHKMKRFIRCNNTGKNQFRELFMCEGNSAAGSARNGSDPDTQAFFMFRGVTANPMKCTLSDIMNNEEWREFITVLRCGIGPTFDINKLYFNRINILTDADVDGYGISSGMLVFIYLYLRPLIEQGYVYKVYSPLYNLNDKNNKFVHNKADMVEIFHKKIVKNNKICFLANEDNKWCSKDELRTFLEDSYDYPQNLVRVANDLGNVDKFFVEIVLAAYIYYGLVTPKPIKDLFKDRKFVRDFMSMIQDKYPETSVTEKGVISGNINNGFYSIKINDRFVKNCVDLIPIITNYGYQLKVKEKDAEPRIMTICEFLDNCNKYTADILTRYKGLGEFNGEDLWATTLDINNRTSIQFTVEDAEREYKKFKKLHGTGKADLMERKEMMGKYRINRFDLDN